MCLLRVCVGIVCGTELKDVSVDRSSEQVVHVDKGVPALAERDAQKEEFRAGLGTTVDSGQGTHKSNGINSDQVTNGVENNGKIMWFFHYFVGSSLVMKSLYLAIVVLSLVLLLCFLKLLQAEQHECRGLLEFIGS